MDETRVSHFSERNVRKRKTSTVYLQIYMESRKMVLMNLAENGPVDTVEEGEGRMS